MGDPVRAVRLLHGDPLSEIATLSTDAGTPGPKRHLIALAGWRPAGRALRQSSGQARFDSAQRRLRSFVKTQDRLRSGQALLSKALARAARDIVCFEPPDLSLTDAAVLILADDPLQTVGRWCADSSQ